MATFSSLVRIDEISEILPFAICIDKFARSNLASETLELLGLSVMNFLISTITLRYNFCRRILSGSAMAFDNCVLAISRGMLDLSSLEAILSKSFK